MALSGYLFGFKRLDAQVELAFTQAKIPTGERVPEWFRVLLSFFGSRVEESARTHTLMSPKLEEKPWELVKDHTGRDAASGDYSA